MTLTEFLLARIAEDEAEIGVPFGRDEKAGPNGIGWAEVGAINEVLMSGHVRALAECEAKRRIMEDHPRCDAHDRPGYECDACQTCGDGSIWPCPTILHLAAIYADHPDHDEAWRA